uniref:Uncharacterized protein n=1 Tax=Cacopsylla melanoneura TaxID=428564 RepID=A0A8D8ULB9_9HEMI
MLSYMVPSTTLDDKPPQIPVKTTRLKLIIEDADHSPKIIQNNNNNNNSVPNNNNLTGKRTIIKTHSKQSNISTESSTSSLSSISTSDLPATHLPLDKLKPKSVISNSNPLPSTSVSNGHAHLSNNHINVTSLTTPTPPTLTTTTTKSATLKRVSFGSSKGSMVETLIYESPLQEEPETSPNTPTPSDGTDDSSIVGVEGVNTARSKVRVSFFESEKPSLVSTPEPLDLDDLVYETMAALDHEPASLTLQRQTSTDSGWDNPFRPDGDLSKEADEIVQLIKGGKPITPTLQQNGLTVTLNGASPIKEEIDSKSTSTPLSKTQNGKSSSTPSSVKKPSSPGQVQVEHGTVDASQVEHVVLKKKPKCKCCTIQ